MLLTPPIYLTVACLFIRTTTPSQPSIAFSRQPSHCKGRTYYIASMPKITCHRNSITLPLCASLFPVSTTHLMKPS